MAKILKTAALVVGAVALVATGVGAIGLAGLAGATTVAGLSTGTLLAISSGLSVASALLMKKPAGPLGNDPEKWKADAFAGLPYQMGRTINAGNIVKRCVHGVKNREQTFVTIYSLGPIHSLGPFFANKTTVTFDGGGNAIGPYRDQIFMNQQLGACPEPVAMTPPRGSPPGWTAASKLSGYAASIMTLSYDSKAKPPFTSVPTPSRIPDGVYVYDPRLDDTYPGGSGPCRARQEDTYVWSECPFLHGLTWCIGRWHNGKRVAGLGALLSQIDVGMFVEGANIRDAMGWKVGGVVYTRPDTPWNVLKLILQAGGAVPVPVGGSISCIINAPRVSLATIRDDDIVGDCSLSATAPRRARINGMLARYRSEAHDWGMVAAKLVQVADYVTADGDERTKTMDFPLVQDVDQVSQLAAYEIADSRELGPGTFPLKPVWMNFRVGDCVTIATRRIASMKVLILDREVDPSGSVVTYTIRSETDAKHPFALGLTGIAPPTASVAAYAPVDTAPALADWALSVESLSASNGTVATLVVTGAADAPNAEAVLFDYRTYDAGAGDDDNWIGAGIEGAGITRKEIAAISAGISYEVSVRYRVKGGDGNRLILGPVAIAAADAPTASLISATGGSGLATLLIQAPQLPGWADIIVKRGPTTNFADAVQSGDPLLPALYETVSVDDTALAAGTYRWWIVVRDGTGNEISRDGPVTATVT